MRRVYRICRRRNGIERSWYPNKLHLMKSWWTQMKSLSHLNKKYFRKALWSCSVGRNSRISCQEKREGDTQRMRNPYQSSHRGYPSHPIPINRLITLGQSEWHLDQSKRSESRASRPYSRAIPKKWDHLFMRATLRIPMMRVYSIEKHSRSSQWKSLKRSLLMRPSSWTLLVRLKSQMTHQQNQNK